jgi:hypothetical protein
MKTANWQELVHNLFLFSCILWSACIVHRHIYPSPFLYSIGLEAVLFVMYVKNKKGSVIPFYDTKIFYENFLQQIVSAIIFPLMG